jgi:hypothetical protein
MPLRVTQISKASTVKQRVCRLISPTDSVFGCGHLVQLPASGSTFKGPWPITVSSELGRCQTDLKSLERRKSHRLQNVSGARAHDVRRRRLYVAKPLRGRGLPRRSGPSDLYRCKFLFRRIPQPSSAYGNFFTCRLRNCVRERKSCACSAI